MEPLVKLFGPVDAVLGPYIGYVLLALLVVNIAGRAIEYERIVEQADDGAEAVSRHPLRVGTNVLLVVGTFYFLTLHHHAGVVFATLVVGLFITDLFEFEARRVEASRGVEIERPKAAIAASILALLYISYITLFTFIKPYWSAIV